MFKNDKEMIEDIEEIIERKIKENDRIIIFSYFEVYVRKNIHKEQKYRFIELAKNRLENMEYDVYFEGEQFLFDNVDRIVGDNEVIIAIKR